MYAVIGLGNPGSKYNGTRHNVGFDVINCLSERNNVKLNKLKHKAVYGEIFINGEKVLLVKPQTFMNNSGISVLELYKYHNVPVENIIVVYDDIDIDIGTMRIRKKGSAGTHNGMKSIIYHLKNDNFPRVRIGIGKPEAGEDLANYVLSRFSKDERILIDNIVEKASLAIEEIIKTDIDKAMNMYNK